MAAFTESTYVIDDMRRIVNAVDDTKDILKDAYYTMTELCLNQEAMVDNLKNITNLPKYRYTRNTIVALLAAYDTDNQSGIDRALYGIYAQCNSGFNNVEYAANADYDTLTKHMTFKEAVSRYATAIKLSLDLINSLGYKPK